MAISDRFRLSLRNQKSGLNGYAETVSEIGAAPREMRTKFTAGGACNLPYCTAAAGLPMPKTMTFAPIGVRL